ncbi:MAG TPA: hypothetical protein VNB29_11085 [Chthoniobacterales bacterium]|nr:hypothetical protein [Chthoniobacterales bacterium]
MPDENSGCPELWDEYQWERFLQQQDRKTEQYFQLFEKYQDHPNRDEIIAREMGWNHSDDEDDDAPDWLVTGEDSEEISEDEESEDEDAELDELQQSAVYMQSMELNRRVFTLVEERDTLKDHPVAVELATRVAICGAKLAAALCGDDLSEVGMTIAYLKRSLKAANDALGAASRLRKSDLIDDDDLSSVTDLLFPIRECIVDMMGELRKELRRRRGEL